MTYHAENHDTVSDGDSELWVACRHGDRTAFTVIYRRHSAKVLRFARSLVSDAAVSEEILQDVFLAAWVKRSSIAVRDDSVLPWLLVATRNFARNARRRREKEAPNIGFDEFAHRSAEPLGEDRDIDAAIAMMEALNNLSAVDRRLCQLCLVEGYSYAAAAEVLQLTESALGKRLQRARERLRRAISVKE